MSVERIAITLEPELLMQVEAMRQKTHESRSKLVARAIRALLHHETHTAAVARYIEAYRETPETPEEVNVASLSAKQALKSLPWDES